MIHGDETGLDVSRQRWTAWFDGTLDQGPVLYIETPLDQPHRPLLNPVSPDSFEQRWIDLDYRIAALRDSFNSRWFGGDAVPSWFPNLGPGIVGACAGPWPDFTEGSVWFNEFKDNNLGSILPQIGYDPDKRFWLLVQQLSRRALKAAAGEFLVGITDLGGDLDILASWRGTERLLTDLIEEPELVKSCRVAIGRLWIRLFEEQNRLLVDGGQTGFSAWLPAWYGKPWSVLQCDISVMLSPAMFEEFALPELVEKSSAMARSIYHLDGPEEWRHLDLVLSVPDINAIQYVSVPGDPVNEDLHWLPYYRRIAESGRGIFIAAEDPAKVLELANKLPAERLACHMKLRSRAEAEEFLYRLGRKTSGAYS
jgi:5-methyltetrahydrofolate--homocysteine methyltransferase